MASSDEGKGSSCTPCTWQLCIRSTPCTASSSYRRRKPWSGCAFCRLSEPPSPSSWSCHNDKRHSGWRLNAVARSRDRRMQCSVPPTMKQWLAWQLPSPTPTDQLWLHGCWQPPWHLSAEASLLSKCGTEPHPTAGKDLSRSKQCRLMNRFCVRVSQVLREWLQTMWLFLSRSLQNDFCQWCPDKLELPGKIVLKNVDLQMKLQDFFYYRLMLISAVLKHKQGRLKPRAPNS